MTSVFEGWKKTKKQPADPQLLSLATSPNPVAQESLKSAVQGSTVKTGGAHGGGRRRSMSVSVGAAANPELGDGDR